MGEGANDTERTRQPTERCFRRSGWFWRGDVGMCGENADALF